jgi:hypothetical protein
MPPSRLTANITTAALMAMLFGSTSAVITDDGPLFGLQTGPNLGPNYAGEVYYDKSSDYLYFTAETYELDTSGPTEKAACLIMGFSMEEQKITKEIVYGNADTLDVCSAISISNPGHLIVVGNSDPAGWATEFTSNGSDASTKLNGLVAVLDKNTLKKASGSKTGIAMMTEDVNTNIPYPQNVYSDDYGNVWVASLTSTDAESNTTPDNYPNWLSDKIEFGSSTYMTISKYSYSETTGDEVMGIVTGGLTIDMDYTQEYPMDPDKNDGSQPRVYIGGVILKNNDAEATNEANIDNGNHDNEFLIVAGSTRGISDGYGPGVGGDEDGYISFIDKDTGQLLDITSSAASAGNLVRNSARIGTFDDDIITGICNDFSDPNSFFVVGATQGAFEDALADDAGPTLSNISLQAFVVKMNIDSLTAQWTRHFPAFSGTTDGSSEAYAMSCVVDGDTVFVTGNVEKDGSMYSAATEEKLESRRGADIWIASMEKQLGDVQWMKQIGTDADDRLAKHGSVVMTKDYLLVYGETNGDFYRPRNADEDDEHCDIFFMVFDPATGQHHALEGQQAEPVGDVMAPPDTFNDGEDDDDTLDDDDNVVGGIDWKPRGTQLEGDLFPGAIVYDSQTHNVKFTGGSYLDGNTKSMCFTGSWDLASGTIKKIFHSGTPGTEEACNAIAWSPFEDKSYAVGFTEAVDGGMFDYMVEDDPALDFKVLGTILQTNANGEPVGGGIIQDENVQYPIAVVTHPSEDYIFVASSSSSSSALNLNMVAEIAHPDLTTGGNRRYGEKFFMSVARYDILSQPDTSSVPLEETMDENWYKYFNVLDHTGVSVSGMALAGDDANTLVLVGSTKGSGSVFGVNSGDDWDGFIIKLDPESGVEIGAVTEERTATRIDSSNQKDDWVNGVCVDKFNPNAVFLVGGTKGKIRTIDEDHQLPEGDIHSFVVKIELDTLEVIWTKHFTMEAGPGSITAEAAAFSCVVAPGEGSKNAVYVAGTILNGAFLDDSIEGESAGGDDIFVIQMDDDGDTVHWIRQIGTNADDRLATTGGLDVDLDGNVIVYGETKGAFYSLAPSGKNDLVAFTMSKKDGSYYPLGSGAPPIIEGDAVMPISDADGDGMEDIAIVDPGEDDDDDDDEFTDSPLDVPDTVLAVQTGPDAGPTYAGGMVYDKWTNAIYMTGATYGSFDKLGSTLHDTSYCFFGVMKLPSLEWKDRETYGTDDAAEACSALALTHHKRQSSVAIVGSTEANGLLTSTAGEADTQYAMLMDLLDIKDEYALVGGEVVDDELIQFPAAVVSKGDTIFVASMWSPDTRITADYEKASKEYPNFTSGGIEKYGSQYGVVLEQFKVKRDKAQIGTGLMQKSFVREWRKPFETVEMASVFVSGLISVGDDLIVVGSTRAGGKGDDMDGILAKVNAADGSFDGTADDEKSVGYFQSVEGADDWIMNACADPEADDHFFVVGATASKTKDSNMINAFVAKINLSDLSPEWVNEIDVLHASGDDSKHAAAIALGCDVVPGSDLIYIAGTVENGARLDYADIESAGRDDIFVAQLSTAKGQIVWMSQIGSNGDDRLARGGGVKADENGDAVVFGDTDGDFFRWNPERNRDLFVLVVDMKTGVYQTPLEGTPFPVDTSAPHEWFGDIIEEHKNSVLMAVAVSVAALILLLICYCRRRKRRKLADNQKGSIFAYLQKFDVEDIDLRKSPPGGWHGTYLNKLAYGINKSETAAYGDLYDDFEARPLNTHSSVVSDSLFMDAASTPSLEYSDTPASYDDLLDKYDKYKDGSEGRPGMEII